MPGCPERNQIYSVCIQQVLKIQFPQGSSVHDQRESRTLKRFWSKSTILLRFFFQGKHVKRILIKTIFNNRIVTQCYWFRSCYWLLQLNARSSILYSDNFKAQFLLTNISSPSLSYRSSIYLLFAKLFARQYPKLAIATEGMIEEFSIEYDQTKSE